MQSWSPRLRPIADNSMTEERARFRRRALRFNLGLALLVWIAWAAAGGQAAFHALLANWHVALTMVFGSLVGGGTSEGGGAVAFPVFTKLLHTLPPAMPGTFLWPDPAGNTSKGRIISLSSCSRMWQCHT